ncbi:hypothetical protein IG193_07800 [Infirmifilum lucidum]|uniref:Uncharacterized protein n=1 Tax=Infirmifilum lucidum TaxID=2776706 RepID=A0A7L9FFQ9_9CREN|nr:hypothetical protein [Infirmifilum lucidum]QOJ78648.1 hypothetical protein IG193_07800 [Infirmifilum lucidum]
MSQEDLEKELLSILIERRDKKGLVVLEIPQFLKQLAEKHGNLTIEEFEAAIVSLARKGKIQLVSVPGSLKGLVNYVREELENLDAKFLAGEIPSQEYQVKFTELAQSINENKLKPLTQVNFKQLLADIASSIEFLEKSKGSLSKGEISDDVYKELSEQYAGNLQAHIQTLERILRVAERKLTALVRELTILKADSRIRGVTPTEIESALKGKVENIKKYLSMSPSPPSVGLEERVKTLKKQYQEYRARGLIESNQELLKKAELIKQEVERLEAQIKAYTTSPEIATSIKSIQDKLLELSKGGMVTEDFVQAFEKLREKASNIQSLLRSIEAK